MPKEPTLPFKLWEPVWNCIYEHNKVSMLTDSECGVFHLGAKSLLSPWRPAQRIGVSKDNAPWMQKIPSVLQDLSGALETRLWGLWAQVRRLASSDSCCSLWASGCPPLVLLPSLFCFQKFHVESKLLQVDHFSWLTSDQWETSFPHHQRCSSLVSCCSSTSGYIST